MKKRVVVIGAGLGGLTVSALLSKKGYDVTVIEKHFVVGGYSSNFKRKSKTDLSFNFDAALHGIGNLREGRYFYEFLKNIGVIDRIKILRKRETATVILDDNNLVDIPDSFLEYKKVMLEQFPNERIGIEKLFSFYEEFDKNVESNLREGVLFDEFIELSNITLYDFLKRFVDNKEFIEMFTVLWGYYGSSPKELNALYFSLSWIGYHIGGTYYIEGGSQALSNAFRDIILENDGKVVLNEEIVEVISEENSIKSVKSSKGNIYSGDIFILNGSPLEFVKLINNEKMIDRIEKELSGREVGSSLTQLYVGLDVDTTELGLEKADYFILGNEEEEYGYKAVLDKEFDKIPFNVVNYNILDPNFNKDTGVIAITIPDIYDNWKDLEREEYLKQKREVTEILLNRVYKYFPKIKEHIVLTELGTPLTMKRYTNNTEGAVYGFKQNINEGGIKRVLQNFTDTNLYLSGSWTQPGGGYEGAIISGEFCADLIEKRYREVKTKSKLFYGVLKLLSIDSFISFFIKKIKRKSITIDSIFQFNFIDIGKSYKIDLKDAKLIDSELKSDVIIDVKYEDWLKIASGVLDGEVAFKTGVLKIKGDINKFFRFRRLL